MLLIDEYEFSVQLNISGSPAPTLSHAARIIDKPEQIYGLFSPGKIFNG